jgi:hypothetical protein
MESASGKQWLTVICHKNRRGPKFESFKADLVAVPIETAVSGMLASGASLMISICRLSSLRRKKTTPC